MLELRPVLPELLAFYLGKVKEFMEDADTLGSPAFSLVLREDLGALLRNPDALRLIEAVARHGRFNDAKDLESMRRAVSRRLRQKGISLSKGKRANHGLVELVGQACGYQPGHVREAAAVDG